MHFWSTIPVQNPAGQVAKMDDGHEDNICLDISTPTSCRRAERSLHAWQVTVTVQRALCTYVEKGHPVDSKQTVQGAMEPIYV